MVRHCQVFLGSETRSKFAFVATGAQLADACDIAVGQLPADFHDAS